MADQATRDRLRRRLGDTESLAFEDADLDLLLTEAGGDVDRALVAGLSQLRAQAAREIDYTVGDDREQASQVFDHLSALLASAQARVAEQTAAVGARTLGTLSTRVAVGW